MGSLTGPVYATVNGNSEIPATNEVLLRQVHPSQWAGDTPSKQAFLPNEEHDQHLLSTRREEMTPRGAYEEWIEKGYSSLGTWGVSAAEAVRCDTPAVDDADYVEVEMHASLDFQQLPSKGQRERRARRLRDAAVDRDCLYSPA